MSNITIDTIMMNALSNMLEDAYEKAKKIDQQLDKYKCKIQPLTSFYSIKYSYIIKENIDFLRYVSIEFENLEEKLSKLDPLNYQPPKNIWNYMADGCQAVYEFGEGVIKTTCATASKYFDAIANASMADIWEIGCKVCTIAISVSTIVGAVTVGVASYGTASPVSWAVIMFSFNQIVSDLSDINDILINDGKNVGKHNFMKNQMDEGGKILGKTLFGNENVGKLVSDTVYFTGNVLGDLANIEDAANYIVSKNETLKTTGRKLLEYGYEEIKFNPKAIFKASGDNPYEWFWSVGRECLELGDTIEKKDLELGKRVCDLAESTISFTKSIIEYEG